LKKGDLGGFEVYPAKPPIKKANKDEHHGKT
jgi:hypothetical protein